MGGQEGVNQPVGTLSVLLGKGTGGFKAAVTTMTGEFLPDGLAVTDVNGDGKRDLLVADYVDGSDYGDPTYCAGAVFLGNGDGTFQAPVEFASGADDALVGELRFLHCLAKEPAENVGVVGVAVFFGEHVA